MSKSFPTPDEAMDVLTAEAALTALDGQRVKLLMCAKEAVQRELSCLEEIARGHSWCLRARDRTSASLRYHWIHGPWFVPVRPRPVKKEYTERSVLCSKVEGSRSVRFSSAESAMAVLWTEMANDDEGASWRHGLGSPSVATAAMAFARLKLAREAAQFWKAMDDVYLGICAVRALG